MVKVSVVIPVRNSEYYLKKCLDSVLNQTLDDIEIIVINDGSEDKSKEIIEEYQKNNKNLILIDKKHAGIGKARNDGIKKATGEYITFVDSDDYIKEDMLEVFYNYAKKYDIDMVTSMYYKVRNGKEIPFTSPNFKIGNVKTSPQILCLVEYGPCAKLYRRKMIVDNNICFEEKKKYEDMPFVSKALLHSKLIGKIDKPYYCYVIHQNSETTTMDSKVFDIFDILKIVMSYYKKEFYLKMEIDYVVINKLTTYMLQQRMQKDKQLRKQFIDEGYMFLNNNISNWKNNKYYKKESIFKRIIKNHKKLLKLYCSLYIKIKRKH